MTGRRSLDVADRSARVRQRDDAPLGTDVAFHAPTTVELAGHRWQSTMRHSTAVTVVLVAATLLGVGCGDDTDNGPTAGGVSSSDDGRIEGVVIDSMPIPGGYSRWLLVDVADGATIAGSSRLAVEAATLLWDCRGKTWELLPSEIEPDTRLTFEPDDTDTRLPVPAIRQAWESAVAVAGGELQVTCPPGSDELTATLAEQRAKWAAAGIDTYEFTLSWRVFNLLSGDYRVTVVDGRPAGVLRMDPAELDPGWEAEVPGSIDEVFDRLESAVGADSVEARYDPDMGYPVAVRVDQVINGVDDELEIRISDLTTGTT